MAVHVREPKHMKPTSRRQFGGLALSAAFGMEAGDAPPANEVLKTIGSLRTIHGDFSEKRVPDEQVEAVISASVRAANASNMQSYSIIVSRDPARIEKVTGYRGNCLLLYCADLTRLIDTAKHMGYEFYADNMDAFITSCTNTILAAQTAVIAAKSMGVDSLLTNGIHRGDIERHWALLDLPQKSCFPLIALMLGYAKQEPRYRMGRLRGPGVVHYEQYHRLTKEELQTIVEQHDDKEQHLYLNEEWKKKGYKHYLDWFYRDWVTGRKPTAAEGPTLRRLKKSGFVDSMSIVE